MKDLNKKFFSKVGFILLLYSVLHNTVSNLLILAIGAVNPALIENPILYYLIALLPTYLIAFPIVFLLFKKLVKAYEFPKHKMKVWQWILAFMIVYGIGISINLVTNIIYIIIRLFNPSFMDTNNLIELMSNMHPFLSVLIIGILAPIIEELVFRKLLIDRLIPYGEAIAILLPGIIFGIFHGNLQQCFFAAAIGIFFSFIYVKTGKIQYTVFMHMGINLYSCMYMILFTILASSGIYDNPELFSDSRYIMEFMPEYLGKVVIPTFIMLGMLFVSFGVVIAGIVLFFVNLRKFKISKQALIPIEKGKVFSTIVFNPGMICFGIFWIVIFVINTIC